MSHTVEIDLGGRQITLETGRMAKQANGAVVVRSGDSVVLVTACMAEEPKPNAGFFPLTVDYREYTYAAGKIPGGFIKREGRPSEKEILTSRMIDRPVRPLFPEGFLNETQIIAMVLSADPEQDPNSLAIVGAGAALAISDIPFQHVLGGVRVGMVKGVYIANPTYSEGRESKLNIIVAATESGIVMVEAGAQQASEEEVIGAIDFGHTCCKKIAAAIRELVAKVGKPKRVFTPPVLDQALYDQIVRPGAGTVDRRAEHRKVSQAREPRPGSRAEEAGSRSPAGRTAGRRQEDLQRLEGAHFPRRDVEEPPPSGRPRFRPDPPDHHRDRRAAANAWLGAVHARRNASLGHGDSGHQGRRAAHRTAGAGRSFQALHVAL